MTEFIIDRLTNGQYDGERKAVSVDQFVDLMHGKSIEFDGQTLTAEDGPFYVPDDSDITERGGVGSGHHGHRGRPGEVGGSLPSHSIINQESIYPDLAEELHGTPNGEGGAWRSDRNEFLAWHFSEDGSTVSLSQMQADVTRILNAATGRGRGTKMLAEVLAEAVRRGAIYFSINPASPAAYRLFSRFERWGILKPNQTYLDVGGVSENVKRWTIEAQTDQEIYETVKEGLGPDWNINRGGPGSGHFGHEGRPGEVGGSQPSGEQRGRTAARAYAYPDGQRLGQIFTGEDLAERVARVKDKWGLWAASNADRSGSSVWMMPDGRVTVNLQEHEDLTALIGRHEHLMASGFVRINIVRRAGTPHAALHFEFDTRAITPTTRQAMSDIYWAMNYDGGEYKGAPQLIADYWDAVGRLQVAIDPVTGTTFMDAGGFNQVMGWKIDKSMIERGGPGSGHFGHEGRPGEVGGSKPSGRGRGPISIPRFKSKQEAVDFMNEHFMGYDRLGTLLIEEESSVPASDKFLTVEDYIEIAETFALLQSKFPDLATGMDHSDYGKVDLLWDFMYPQGVGSYYENAVSGSIYVNTQTYASFAEQQRNRLKRWVEEGYQGDTDPENAAYQDYQRIVEEYENINDPEARRRNHSLYWTPNLEEDQFAVSMLHEFGHYIHIKNHYQDYFDGLPGSPERNNTWEEDYGVTLRATDSWRECMAENFTIWALGHTEALHPDIVSFFDSLSERYGG